MIKPLHQAGESLTLGAAAALTLLLASASIIVGVGEHVGGGAGPPQHAPLRACHEHCDEVMHC